MELPEKLKYTESHEWVADNGDGTVTVGITAEQVERVYKDIQSKRRSTAYQHAQPLLIEPVLEKA